MIRRILFIHRPGVGAEPVFKETIVTRRNTAQQRARELQQSEGIGYHEALNQVRGNQQPEPEINSSVVLTDSTLIVIEATNGGRCMACQKSTGFDEWALHLVDVATYGRFDPVLCPSCAKAIGNAVAHIPAPPAPDPQDPDTIRVAAGAGRDRVVAYLSQDRVHLLCRRHTPKAPISNDYQSVTAEGLEALGQGFRPGGGGHRCSVCNLDVLTV